MSKLNGDKTLFGQGFAHLKYDEFKGFFDSRYDGDIKPHLKHLGIEEPKKPKRNKGGD